MHETLLTVQDVTKRLNCATSTLYRWQKLGKFPRPLNIGGMVRWKEEDLRNFIAQADLGRKERGPRPSGIRRGRPVGSYNKKK